jgi:sodium transport system ATP-binding protein
MIDVCGLHKRFGEVVAVEELSFVAADAKITALLGPNGAGKTSALRMVSGLALPDRGTVRVDGIDPSARPLAVRQRIGILPDARGLYPRLTARENVRYYGELHGMAKEALERRIDELFAMLDLADLAERRTAGFSHGERMKVAIARALIHDPQNVVLDEPTNGLDVMSIRSLRKFIRSLKEGGRALLFSSHVMQEVAALSDEIVVMAAGRVVASGTSDELRARTGAASLEEAFVKLTLAERYVEDGEVLL